MSWEEYEARNYLNVFVSVMAEVLGVAHAQEFIFLQALNRHSEVCAVIRIETGVMCWNYRGI